MHCKRSSNGFDNLLVAGVGNRDESSSKQSQSKPGDTTEQQLLRKPLKLEEINISYEWIIEAVKTVLRGKLGREEIVE